MLAIFRTKTGSMFIYLAVKGPKTCHEGQILTFSITFPSTSLHEVDVILLGCDRANAPIFTFLTLFKARI